MANKSSQSSQYFAAFAAAIGAMAQSTAVGWTTQFGPIEINKVILTDEQLPWVSSTLTFAAGSTCILTGLFANFIGRKTATLLLVIPFTIGWTLLIFAENYEMVIMGRALHGIYGGVCALVPIYIAEIAEARIRGLLCCLFQVLSSVGTLFMYVVGEVIPTSQLSLACSAIPLIFGVFILFCPESPTYLIQKNRRGDASRALLWLRGKNYDPSIELNAIQAASIVQQALQQREQQQGQNQQQQPQPRQQGMWSRPLLWYREKEFQQQQPRQQGMWSRPLLWYREKEFQQEQPRQQGMWSRPLLWHREKKFQPHQYKEVLKSILQRSSAKAFFISYGLFICQQMCGINTLSFYRNEIFAIAETQVKTRLNPDKLTASIVIVATILSGFVVDRLGRRVLLLASQIVITICSLSLGCFLFMRELKPTSVDNLNWIPLAILYVFTVAFSIGLGPIPFVIFGEIFPIETKCLAGSITASANLYLGFITTKTHKNLDNEFGMYGVFWLYSSISLLGTVFVYFVVPETKGQSLNNIQHIINEVKIVPADSDGWVEDGDNIAMKQLGNRYRGKYFTM